tara:strand:- start:2348 stop:2890 length:543 start_codon:yes stop_codon:yes gene_type:complete
MNLPLKFVKAWGNRIRNLWFFHVRYPWIKYGRNVHMQSSTVVFSPNRRIVFGNNVGIGQYCVLQTDIEIGNDVMLAAHVGIIARDAHTFDQVGVTIFESPRGDRHQVVIEDDVWIGFGAIILSGVRVGRGSIVAAGAVVKQDIPRYSIVAGNPAKVVRSRFSADQADFHDAFLQRRYASK